MTKQVSYPLCIVISDQGMQGSGFFLVKDGMLWLPQ